MDKSRESSEIKKELSKGDIWPKSSIFRDKEKT